MYKQIITLKYEEYCNRGMFVLWGVVKEGMDNSASMARESFKEVTFELDSIGSVRGGYQEVERYFRQK